jgi:hypothetical protein
MGRIRNAVNRVGVFSGKIRTAVLSASTRGAASTRKATKKAGTFIREAPKRTARHVRQAWRDMRNAERINGLRRRPLITDYELTSMIDRAFKKMDTYGESSTPFISVEIISSIRKIRGSHSTFRSGGSVNSLRAILRHSADMAMDKLVEAWRKGEIKNDAPFEHYKRIFVDECLNPLSMRLLDEPFDASQLTQSPFTEKKRKPAIGN